MPDNPPVQFLVFKSIRRRLYEFHACPACKRAQEGIHLGKDEQAECYGCGGKFAPDIWGKKMVARFAATCAACGEETPLTGYHCDAGPSWFCECGNMLVYKFRSAFVSPGEMLSFDWVSEMHRRSVKLTRSLRISDCRTKREHLITWILFYFWREEEGAFIFGDWKERKALVCMDGNNYIGYIFWSNSDGETPVLRQIFVRKEWQRKGVGMAMARYWAGNYGFPFAERFGVESPNIKSLRLLEKLGYLELDQKANKVKFTRCYRVFGT